MSGVIKRSSEIEEEKEKEKEKATEERKNFLVWDGSVIEQLEGRKKNFQPGQQAHMGARQGKIGCVYVCVSVYLWFIL